MLAPGNPAQPLYSVIRDATPFRNPPFPAASRLLCHSRASQRRTLPSPPRPRCSGTWELELLLRSSTQHSAPESHADSISQPAPITPKARPSPCTNRTAPAASFPCSSSPSRCNGSLDPRTLRYGRQVFDDPIGSSAHASKGSPAALTRIPPRRARLRKLTCEVGVCQRLLGCWPLRGVEG